MTHEHCAEVMNELVRFIHERITYRTRQLEAWRAKPSALKREDIERELEGRVWELESILDHYHASHPDPSRETITLGKSYVRPEFSASSDDYDP